SGNTRAGACISLNHNAFSKSTVQVGSRDWVKFEIEEAEKAFVTQKLSGALAYIIDPDLSVDALPVWMKSALITKQASPALVASDIRRAINTKISETRPKHFIGRTSEVDQTIDLITSFTSPDYRPPIVLYGLPGIGRRSLLESVARDGLSLKRTHLTRLIHQGVPEGLAGVA
ncbi:hypothetical protein V2I08_20550, partial [Sphingobium sp. MK2]